MSQLPEQSTPSTGLRALNIEARRQRILAAARQLMASQGLAALSMRKLAKEAGLSVTTLYNLFGVREDILRALVLDAIDRMDWVLEREAPLDNPIERCRAVITVSIAHIVENEAIFRPMIIAANAAPVSDARDGRAITHRAVGMQSLAIQAAIDQGLLKPTLDPTQLGHQIYHGYEFAFQQWAHGRVDAAGFEARALYGLEIALLAVASDRLRPELESELQRLEKQLSRERPTRTERRGKSA